MASTRVRGAGPVGQEPDLGRVPERMDFVGDWVTGKGEKIELWTDNRIGDGIDLTRPLSRTHRYGRPDRSARKTHV